MPSRIFLLSLVWLIAAVSAAQQAADLPSGRIDDTPVSVQLGTETRSVEVASAPGQRGLLFLDATSGAPLLDGERLRSASIKPDPSGLLVNGQKTKTSCLHVIPEDEILVVREIQYRGSIQITATASGQLTVRNVLPLHWYLASVIGAEMPDWAPAEALKAQCIISRSYILHRIDRSPGASFAVCDTVLSQVYHGISSESHPTRKAVQDAANLVLLHNEKVIDACFSAESGGHTACALDVWGQNVPYLQGKKDPFSENGQYAQWRFSIPRAELQRLLARDGRNVGNLQEIAVSSRDTSGRARTFSILGSNGNTSMRGTDLRLLIGPKKLRSTMCNVQRRGARFVFTGKGYGHGVGLSQWGACKMAQAGYSCEQILKFYYTGVTISEYSTKLERQSPVSATEGIHDGSQ